MNESSRRFTKSGHYVPYLASIVQSTIKKVVKENWRRRRIGIMK